jgi:hypothetical protein
VMTSESPDEYGRLEVTVIFDVNFLLGVNVIVIHEVNVPVGVGEISDVIVIFDVNFLLGVNVIV